LSSANQLRSLVYRPLPGCRSDAITLADNDMYIARLVALVKAIVVWIHAVTELSPSEVFVELSKAPMIMALSSANPI
jgi:hypothetical protein